MTPEIALILIWATFLILSCLAAIAVFLWAIRSGQFGDQERARSLPLHARIPGTVARRGKG
jgi:cbb3-type cytochrome oxidase maturation protein